MLNRTANFLRPLAALAAVLSLAVGVHAQIDTGVPEELKGIDIIEHSNDPLPLDARFTDDSGAQVSLRDYFKGERPVLLQLGYNKCPMLCNLVLNGAFDGLKGIEWMPGKEFEVIAISIDPTETPALASAKKESYLAEFERPGARQGVHFLTGSAIMSKSVADAVGFQYRRQENGDYAHAAVLVLITPDGRISRYMYGTKFESSDLRMGLLEASQGNIGTTIDRFILWCHIYDANARGYVLQARRVMSIGGLVTLLVLAGGLAVFWAAEIKKKKSLQTAPAATAVAVN
ncbi:MAG: SCO family protein [Planctomycetota bacterium]|nr:MAG: SCO family protein [Planctomycetota bacterium]